MLQPHIESAPPGVMPILFLDSYRCHMMASVVTRIQNLGVEVQHIPGGCTSLCQPVDIGVNKPFKNRLRSEWEKWMILEGLEHGTTSPPTRADIIRWCRFAMNDLPEQMVKNAWRHAEYSWFPPPPLAAAPNGDEELDNANAAPPDNQDNELDDNDSDNNESDDEEEDNESSSHLFSSSDREDEALPPLPSTHDFVAALESNVNHKISNEDSQLTTLSNK